MNVLLKLCELYPAVPAPYSHAVGCLTLSHRASSLLTTAAEHVSHYVGSFRLGRLLKTRFARVLYHGTPSQAAETVRFARFVSGHDFTGCKTVRFARFVSRYAFTGCGNSPTYAFRVSARLYRLRKQSDLRVSYQRTTSQAAEKLGVRCHPERAAAFAASRRAPIIARIG